MTFAQHAFRRLAPVALICAAGTAQATLTTFTSQASFNAAVTNPATDTFDDLPLGTNPSPLLRTAGPYGYTAVESGGIFFDVGTASDVMLSTNNPNENITFAGFTGGVGAIGGTFFGTDFNGAFKAGWTIFLHVTDADQTLNYMITDATPIGFTGFVSSTHSILSLVVNSIQTTGTTFPTVNNLVLAQAGDQVVLPPLPTTVPEPQGIALVLAALAGGAWARRRRRAAAVTR